jgi:hypothetical protein
MKSKITKDFGVALAENFESAISNGTDFLYVMMGRSAQWSGGDTLETPYDTTEYKNAAFKNGIILKKVTGSDVQPVVPRVDWEDGEYYAAYSETANTFAKTSETEISDILLSVESSSNNVTGNTGSDLTTAISGGDIIRIGEETKEVAYVNIGGDFLVVNTAFTSAPYSDEIGYLTNFASPTWQYYDLFYVRNTYDQVFKCLFNNGGIASTYMPEITLGGQLPENPYVETADGYKWKYLYTIPSGLKKKFFTNHYMPVLRDPVVYSNAENGRIDIVKILDGGTGYFSNNSTTNYPILSVSGDGYGANCTVDVVNGVITEVNVVDGGHDYTYATVSISDPLQTTGDTANLSAVISPQYGHGYDPARELGASFEMISADFQGNVDDFLPTGNNPVGSTDDFRQICLVRNPRLNASNTTSTGATYLMCTKVFVENRTQFDLDANVYVGSQASPSFTAKVVFYDINNGILYLNNIYGDADEIIGLQIYQENSVTKFAQAFSVTKPDINTLSGEILYIENRSAVTRSVNQTETAKIVIEF